MTRQSTPQRSIFSASNVLETLGNDLKRIKDEDGLTFADIGRVLGKSEDQASKYCSGYADMGFVSYAAGKREWNGRFTGSLEQLCIDSRPANLGDHAGQSAILKAALALSVALEDGVVDVEEVRANRATLENALAAIKGQLAKLKVAAA